MDNDIVFDQVSYTYNLGSPFEHHALNNVSIHIPKGKVTSIIGHTGSGKSTLIQHLNVLLKPTQGRIQIGDRLVTPDSQETDLKQLRKQVGVVFQFPESQLFDETVLKDVMFGPLNFGASEEEAEEIARKQLELVGLSEGFYDRSPFDLSGGQMRRVAIAGVLALEPQVLVLDEPTAGLDPLGHKQMMDMFMNLQKERQLTLVLVSHQMEDVAQYSDQIIVMESGQAVKVGPPEDVFSDVEWLRSKHLTLPLAMQYYEEIMDQLNIHCPKEAVLNAPQLADRLLELKREWQGGLSDE
ncbi:energy-coupling factor ABC transporter ATP-binding protein [Hutsoniella sourekii]|uniref:energy-coupling factor ABC transporter ATP-binding protein n=1 Tax=Hutsoniella sourekii TaxID=87650 RepID=UPI000485699E|nr:energy-coupling factor ABC transporter ATP-binding protein [Hutsoniella sourekii]